MMDIVGRYMFGGEGIISLFVAGFVIVDFLLISYGGKVRQIKKKYRVVYSFLITGILGGIGLTVIGKNIFSIAFCQLERKHFEKLCINK